VVIGKANGMDKNGSKKPAHAPNINQMKIVMKECFVGNYMINMVIHIMVLLLMNVYNVILLKWMNMNLKWMEQLLFMMVL